MKLDSLQIAFVAWVFATAMVVAVFLVQLATALMLGTLGTLLSNVSGNWPLILGIYAGAIVLLFLVISVCNWFWNRSRHRDEIGYPKKWQNHSRDLIEKDRRRRTNRRSR